MRDHARGIQVTCTDAPGAIGEMLKSSPRGVITIIGAIGSGKSVAISGVVRLAPTALPGVSIFVYDCANKGLADLVALLLAELGVKPIAEDARFTRLALHRGLGERGPLLVAFDNVHHLDDVVRTQLLTLAGLHDNVALLMAGTRPLGHHLERAVRLVPLSTEPATPQESALSPAGLFLVEMATQIHPALIVDNVMAEALNECARLVGGNPRCLHRLATLLDKRTAFALRDRLGQDLYRTLGHIVSLASGDLLDHYEALTSAERAVLLHCALPEGLFTLDLMHARSPHPDLFVDLLDRMFKLGLAELVPDAITGQPRASLHPVWRDLCRRRPPLAQRRAAALDLAQHLAQLAPLTPSITAEQAVILQRESTGLASLLATVEDLPVELELRLRALLVLAHLGSAANCGAIESLAALLRDRGKELSTDAYNAGNQLCALGRLRASDFAGAREHLAALAANADKSSPAVRVGAAVTRALVVWTGDGWQAALHLLEAVQAEDLAAAPAPCRADYQILRGYFQVLAGDLAAALSFTESADADGTPLTMTYRGISYLELGRAEQALEGLRRDTATAERLGDSFSAGAGTTRMGIPLFCLGQFRQADEAFLRGIKIAAALQSGFLDCVARCWRAALHLAMKDAAAARGDAQRALDAATSGVQTLAAQAGAVRAICFLGEGKPAQAAALAAESRAFLDVGGLCGLAEFLDAIEEVAQSDANPKALRAAEERVRRLSEHRSLRIRALVPGLAHELARRSPQHGDLRVLRDGTAYQLVGEPPVDLCSRKTVAKLLAALVHGGTWSGGAAIAPLALAALVWPESSDAEALLNRLRVTVNALRSSGARRALDSSEHGYRIVPDVRVVIFDGKLPIIES